MHLQFSSKSFAGVRILESFSLDLQDLEVSIVVGPSGVGKTTLLRLVAGLEADDSGKLLKQERISFVFQEPRLLPWLTVRENIEIVGKESGWLTRLGLTGAEDYFPRQLSLGMARRVALARAFAYKPSLLVLDEPFASLDQDTAATVRGALADLVNSEQITTLMVTHDDSDARYFSAQVFTLQGRPARLTATQ